MKLLNKGIVIARFEALLWLVGLYCVGVFIYMQYNAAQATQEAVALFGNKTVQSAEKTPKVNLSGVRVNLI